MCIKNSKNMFTFVKVIHGRLQVPFSRHGVVVVVVAVAVKKVCIALYQNPSQSYRASPAI